MDFFSQQDRARGSTRKLVFLFACAVITLILLTSALVYGVLFYTEANGGAGGPAQGFDVGLLATDVFLLVAVAVVAVVGLGSLFRLAQLRGGGRVVAESLHGRLINLNTRDYHERKVLNVVEEMAIASGLPVPPVYVIDDPAINAFAAGQQCEDAVIGVTRGTIEQLDRDELQGVIAHEFSHIFNGDMRLNMRLIGVLYGIMVIGLIGYFLMRGGMFTPHRRNRKGGIIFLGLGLAVIGYGGTFFGNLIKAAVSRQREFLADASAVQYTRNPAGIAGALKKIGGYGPGSRVSSVDTREISHMLFEEGGGARLAGLFATHPPLSERIRRIEPDWQGDFAAVKAAPASAAGAPGASGFAGAVGPAIEDIGNPRPQHLMLAHELLERIPPALREELHSTLGAVSAMLALLLDRADEAIAAAQKAMVEDALPAPAWREFTRVEEKVAALPRELYLPLVELALPALKQLSDDQYRSFMTLLGRMSVADERIDLLEWCLFRLLRAHLDPRPGRRGQYIGLKSAAPACEVLLSVLACAGQEREAARRQAFEDGAALLADKAAPRFRPEFARDMEALDRALSVLRRLKPLQKPLLLKAMVKCIDADGQVKPAERELLRAVGVLLDCPIPPLLTGQKFL